MAIGWNETHAAAYKEAKEAFAASLTAVRGFLSCALQCVRADACAFAIFYFELF